MILRDRSYIVNQIYKNGLSQVNLIEEGLVVYASKTPVVEVCHQPALQVHTTLTCSQFITRI
jgi:hypothetical protein